MVQIGQGERLVPTYHCDPTAAVVVRTSGPHLRAMDWLTEHPLWRNVVARTTIYYLIAGGLAAAIYRYVPSAWGMLGGETLTDLLAPPAPSGD